MFDCERCGTVHGRDVTLTGDVPCRICVECSRAWAYMFSDKYRLRFNKAENFAAMEICARNPVAVESLTEEIHAIRLEVRADALEFIKSITG